MVVGREEDSEMEAQRPRRTVSEVILAMAMTMAMTMTKTSAPTAALTKLFKSVKG